VLLANTSVDVLLQAVDFSRDILSLMHGELKICAYPHHGYWEDVGSLKDYYAANMALAADVSSCCIICWWVYQLLVGQASVLESDDWWVL
jgi:ADP-glucose pyrophosphorylase